MPLDINNRILIFLLSSIGLITLPHVYNVPTSIFAFFVVLLSWRFLAIWKKNLLPHTLIVFLITLGGLLLMFTQYHSVLGRDAGTSLFVLGLGLKLLEIKSLRDLYLIVFLAFIVACSLFLYEQSILMAAYILVVCCTLLATLVTMNSLHPQTWVALKKSALIIVQALPIAAVLFVLFPRIEAPRWMLFKNDTQAKLGLSDTLEPGSISDLSLSAELVFRVKFKGDIPPPELRYWRGPTFSYTDGKRWTHTGDYVVNPALDTPHFTGKAYQYTVLMEPQAKNWVYALEMPVKFSNNLDQNATYQLITRELPDKRIEYQMTSHTDYNTGYLTKSELRDNLQLPRSPSSEIKTLVTQLHGFDHPPEVFIQTLLDYFKNEKFYYTLKPPLMEKNPIETFLFKTRYGFCSHYATAFVYLMRVAHIPARVIGGYQGGEMNKVGQFLEVRQADAHAWAEVWLKNKGWVRFDPTAAIAPERVERGVNVEQQLANQAVDFSPVISNNFALAWLKQAQQAWQTVDYSWQRWVINYDRANQSAFLASLGIRDLRVVLYAMLCMITGITALLAWWLLKNNQRHTDKVVRVYDKFCQKFAKVALERRSNEGAQDFAVRASLSLPEYSEQINTITAIYLKLRYGKNPAPQLFVEFTRLVAQFKLSK